MKDYIKISVIIPTYKTDTDSFIRCIESIMKQNFDNYEIIIIDDGNSVEYREHTYSDTIFDDEKIKIVYQENRGVSVARNKGIEIAAGEYITFVDADDVVLKGFFNLSYEIAVNDNVDIVVGGVILKKTIDYNRNYSNTLIQKTYLSTGDASKFKTLFVGKLIRFKDSDSYIGRGPVGKLIKSNLAKKILFDRNLKIYEDTVWNLDLCDISNRICIVNQPWYGYICNMQSASQGFHKDEIMRSTLGMNEIRKRLDLTNKAHRQALFEQCISEYGRIVNTYFINNLNTSKLNVRYVESKKMVHTTPWNIINEYWREDSVSNVTKLKAFLISKNLWLSYKLMKKKIISLL